MSRPIKWQDTYPAYKLYPLRMQGIKEHIYLSRRASKRIQSVFEYIEEIRCPHKIVAAQMGCSLSTLRAYMYNQYMPGLRNYLALMRWRYGGAMGNWLRVDVNYAYAMVKYPPAEIKRRLLRLGHHDIHGKPIYDYGFIANELHIASPSVVMAAVNYAPTRNAQTYGMLMHWLAQKEAAVGFCDALHFER